MLVDANILLFAADETSAQHDKAAEWLTQQLNGDRRVGLPWESLSAFVRIATHPRAAARPLTPAEAWKQVEEWLAVPIVWIPLPTDRHAAVFGGLVTRYNLAGNLIPDAHVAALAVEHGLTVCSADTDFARFSQVVWLNPLAV
jgi:hypothetical protein